MFEKITVREAISFAPIWIIIVTVCYEYGYFHILDFQPLILFTLTDLFSSAITWLPFVITATIIVLLIHSINFIKITGPIPKIITIDTKTKFWIWFLIFILTTSYIPNYGEYNYSIILFTTILVLYIAQFLLSSFLEGKASFILGMLIASAYCAFSFGFVDGKMFLTKNTPLAKIESVNYPILKKFQDGALVYDENKKEVIFIKNEFIESIIFKAK